MAKLLSVRADTKAAQKDFNTKLFAIIDQAQADIVIRTVNQANIAITKNLATLDDVDQITLPMLERFASLDEIEYNT